MVEQFDDDKLRAVESAEEITRTKAYTPCHLILPDEFLKVFYQALFGEQAFGKLIMQTRIRTQGFIKASDPIRVQTILRVVDTTGDDQSEIELNYAEVKQIGMFLLECERDRITVRSTLGLQGSDAPKFYDAFKDLNRVFIEAGGQNNEGLIKAFEDLFK